MKFVSFVLTLAVIAGIAPHTPAQAQAQSPQQSPIRVEGAWARPTPGPSKTGAVYMTLVNTGTVDDRLLSASTPVAGTAEPHITINDNGVMKMRPAGAVDVKPGTPTAFQPGGLHVMLMDLKAPLAEGQSFPLTLVFDKAGTVDVSVHVQKAAPAGAGGMGPMNMSH